MLPLLDWYDAHRRSLPWREEPSPYRTWVSEIMLQQTTVAAVVPFFHRWMERFPTVEDLASAEVEEVLAAWQGLGYYRRARMLHQGARWVVSLGWPRSAAEWREVPGVGAYTAGAISSIAQGLSEAVVDGNVERVFARVTGCALSGPALNRAAWDWARRGVPNERPGDYNQALMELGATVCTPRSPDCGGCPCSSACFALQLGKVESLPTPVPKPEVIQLSHVCAIPRSGGLWGVRQIPAGRWWEGMWEFPREESLQALEVLLPGGTWTPLGSFRHTVTRHRIRLEVLLWEGETLDGLRWVEPAELAILPLPAPMRRAEKMGCPRL
jgi:A/G-specific adenine glycosylase